MRKALIFLGILDDTDIDWIIRNGTKMEIDKGTVLIHQGRPIKHVYFVLRGEFKIATGRIQKEISRLRSGEILGEMSFIDSRPPSATVTATEDSEIGLVDRERLRQRLEVDVRFAARFYQAIALLLSSRLRTTVANLGYDEESDPYGGIDSVEEIPPLLTDKLALASTRFTEMRERSWGD